MKMTLFGLCTLFSKVTLFCLQKCSVSLKYAKNALVAGAPPRTPLGELTRLPGLLVGWGEGRLLPNSCPFRAFGASILLLATPLQFSHQ